MAKSKKKILNREQLEAIKHGKGPLLIIAGAGTGKTTVITERIKYLIGKELAKPSEILALTFTDKAAREMEERVDVIMPYGYTQMWISTFHSFCDRVLRDEAVHIGLDPGFRLLTEAEATQFLRKNIFQFKLNYFRPLGNPTKFIRGMRQHFSRLQDEDISPEQYLKYAKDSPDLSPEEIAKTIELAHAYQKYSQLKAKESLMDFADLITNTLRLFRERPNVLAQYQDQFKFILVDEFQDTNIAQNELAILLAGKKQDITVCADDDQAIYRWRGAAVSNVIQFKKRFPKAKIVVLTKNYRSTQEVLDQAYQLIQHNNPDRLEVKERISKKLVGMRKIAGEEIKFLYADRAENEAELVAKEIKSLTLTPTSRPTSHPAPRDNSPPPYDFKDIAILVRANNHADAFVRALSRAGIPYQFLGPGQLFRQPEVKDLIAYLKVLYNFEDSVSMYRVLAMDHWGLLGRDLAAINNFARKLNFSLFEACEKITKTQNTTYHSISPKSRKTLKEIVAMIHRHLKLVPKETAGQILYYFLEDSGILQKMIEVKSATEERRTQNISKFFDKLKTYEVDHEDASVAAVCDWIELSMELGESPLTTDLDWTENNAVNLLTIHSSKGLEFPIIFLVNLVAARFPSVHRREQIPIPDALIKEILPEGDYHTQEERRLFYVGMTRAQDRLFLTAANYYGEGKREKKLSPFVFEAMGEISASQRVSESASQLSFLDWQKPEVDNLPAGKAGLPSRLADKLPITYLSFSQIDTFNTCPLQYRYRYIQKIPVPPSAAGSFGQSIHTALCRFYQQVKRGQKPSKDDLVKLLETNWSPLGYTSKAHEERMKKEGKKMLVDFYDQAYDHKVVPKDLEQLFTIRISPSFKVGGRIDRVDEFDDGSLEVIDYKTGKPMAQSQADQSLQMTVYGLAAVDPGIYKKEPGQLTLSFYFLGTGEKLSTKRTGEQLQKAKKELLEKKKEIENSKFEPKPGIMCDFCDFKMICEAWQ